MEAAENLRERLRQAVAESAACLIEEMIWKIADDPSEAEQVASLIADLPDAVKTQAWRLLEGPAGAAGVPAFAAVPASDIVTAVLLDPILEPVEDALHVLEVVGVVIGMAVGLHPLVITCVEHLAFDQIGSALTTAIKRMMECTASRCRAQPASGYSYYRGLQGRQQWQDPCRAGSRPVSSDTLERIKAGSDLGSMSASDFGQEDGLSIDIGSTAEVACELSSDVNLFQI